MSESNQPSGDALPRILGAERPENYDWETVISNGKSGTAILSICIPTYRDDATELLIRLAGLKGAEKCTLLLYDDGSGDPAIIEAHETAIMSFPGPARFIIADRNFGRSHARNRLVSKAETAWILLLDADMLPDTDRFLSEYLDTVIHAEGPKLVAGGFSIKQLTPKRGHRLHERQAALSDTVDAATRAIDPGRFVFTSNILVHKDILHKVPFDEGFSGWGWEDVDWGFRVVQQFPILHIENTATHLGMDSDTALIAKFGSSGQNYARLLEKHPVETSNLPLTKAARRLKGIPLIKPIGKLVASLPFIPLSLRTMALKVYRASAYSEFIDK